MTRGWIAVAIVGGAFAVADAVVGLTWPVPIPHGQIALHVAIGLAWLVAGLVAWARRPELRIGPLMAAVAIAWYWEQEWWPTPFEFTRGLLFEDLPFAVGLHAVIAFPEGRLRTRLGRILVAGAYATVLVGNLLSALFAEPRCQGCARNLLLVHHSEPAEQAIGVVQGVVGAAIGVVAIGMFVRRWDRATAAGRAVLGPVLVASAVTLAIIVASILADLAGVAPWLDHISWLAVGIVPVAFLVGLVGTRLRRTAMTGLMLELAELPPPRRVADALAHALGDPTMRLAFWMPGEQRYVDLDGAPTTVTTGDPHRAVTMLEYAGERFAALEHDPFLYEDRELLEAVCAAVRITIENTRLQAQLRAQLTELRASRARIIEAGDAERRRLERDLHDGAQQRLLGIRLVLRLARARVGDDAAEVEHLLGEADTELMAGLNELRALARGIHPAVLTDEGLPAALGSLARRATVPVEIHAELDERPAPPIEAAAYFVASEALANVAKHAHASNVTITVARANGAITLEVADDGVGGADVARGSGLSGLRDRVDALDGHLEIISRPAAGTKLRAEFPCA